MDAVPWFWIWVVLAAALCIVEMLTLGFFLLPFAIGAAVAAIANFFGANLAIQWMLFVAVSVLMLVILRRFANRVTKTTNVASGVERLIGRTGEVIASHAPEGLFRVRVEREEWNASIESGEQPAIGAKVKVISVDGTRLIVTAYDEESERV
ncbi:MAG: NfeD family protein [Coriobacteriia bacterium]|nr:NfeD family protein [Coriobacteriia bacterium]